MHRTSEVSLGAPRGAPYNESPGSFIGEGVPPDKGAKVCVRRASALEGDVCSDDPRLLALARDQDECPRSGSDRGDSTGTRSSIHAAPSTQHPVTPFSKCSRDRNLTISRISALALLRWSTLEISQLLALQTPCLAGCAFAAIIASFGKVVMNETSNGAGSGTETRSLRDTLA